MNQNQKSRLNGQMEQFAPFDLFSSVGSFDEEELAPLVLGVTEVVTPSDQNSNLRRGNRTMTDTMDFGNVEAGDPLDLLNQHSGQTTQNNRNGTAGGAGGNGGGIPNDMYVDRSGVLRSKGRLWLNAGITLPMQTQSGEVVDRFIQLFGIAVDQWNPDERGKAKTMAIAYKEKLIALALHVAPNPGDSAMLPGTNGIIQFQVKHADYSERDMPVADPSNSALDDLFGAVMASVDEMEVANETTVNKKKTGTKG